MTPEQTPIHLDGAQMMVDSSLSFSGLTQSLKTQIGPDRVISEVKVGDRYVAVDEEQGLGSHRLADLAPVEIFTKEVAALLKESLELAPQICEALLLDCQDVSQFFQANEIEKAHERIGEVSSLVDWLLQCIVSLQSYGDTDFRNLEVKEGNLIESVKTMERVLGELHQLLQAGNFTRFEALLMGEFQETIKLWKLLFEKAATCWIPRSSKTAS